MNKALYLECYAGISGDMFVGAMLDLGVDAAFLTDSLKTLPLEGYDIKISRVQKMSLSACDFNVILEHDNHDHDMEYLYGKGDAAEHKHDHAHEHRHAHTHRHLSDVLQIIDASKISDNAKSLARKIFTIIAQAEAKAHGKNVEEVHFHEVGAVDSIVDITAAAVCIDALGISEVICPSLTEGRGCVRCQHGLIPIPVPAVVNIAAAHKLKLHFTDQPGEFITPTGAAIVSAVKTSDTLPDTFTIAKVGIGAGKRQYDIPNVLRAMLIEY